MELDIQMARFLRDGQELSEKVLQEAKDIQLDVPEEAARKTAIAWGIVNALCMAATDCGAFTKIAKLETIRQKIRVMSGELVAMGFMPTTMPMDGQLGFTQPSTQTVFEVTPKNLEQPDRKLTLLKDECEDE